MQHNALNSRGASNTTSTIFLMYDILYLPLIR
jgi:hypothetical protein